VRVDLPFYGKDEHIEKLVASVGERVKTIYGEDTETSLLHIIVH